jgi:hypothetical protein
MLILIGVVPTAYALNRAMPAVAIALGLGTMIGWKRIVVTVGGEDRQDPPHLWARRICRARRRRHHRGRGRLRASGIDHPRAVVRHRWRHGGQRIGPAMVDHPQHRNGLGADPACRHPAVGDAVLDLQPVFLVRSPRECTIDGSIVPSRLPQGDRSMRNDSFAHSPYAVRHCAHDVEGKVRNFIDHKTELAHINYRQLRVLSHASR